MWWRGWLWRAACFVAKWVAIAIGFVLFWLVILLAMWESDRSSWH